MIMAAMCVAGVAVFHAPVHCVSWVLVAALHIVLLCCRGGCAGGSHVCGGRP